MYFEKTFLKITFSSKNPQLGFFEFNVPSVTLRTKMNESIYTTHINIRQAFLALGRAKKYTYTRKHYPPSSAVGYK